MAVITQNTRVCEGIYRMRVENTPAQYGQFYMLKPDLNTLDPLLGRPISVFDCVDGASEFVYRVAGRGTQLLAQKRAGDEVRAIGPFGNGFPVKDEPLVVIGGGIGIAPLYGLLREHARRFPAQKRTAYLGYSEQVFLREEFAAACDTLVINQGGFITDDVDFTADGYFCACGPVPMFRAAKKRAEAAGSVERLFLSLENRMACGAGACLGCTCQTLAGNKRVCKDGPVFPASEVLL